MKKCILLYKNHRYKFLSMKKLYNSKHLENLEFLLVPLVDKKGCFVPIKIHNLPKFHHAIVKSDYNTNIYDFELDESMDVKKSSFNYECNNMIELANAVYNLFKFRGISMLIAEYLEYDLMPYSYTLYPTKIVLEFYDGSNRLIHSIGNLDMGPIVNSCEFDFSAYPPQYQCEDRLTCLSEYFYTPVDPMYTTREPDIDGLPSVINVLKSKHWEKVKYFSKINLDSEFILRKSPTMSAYFIVPLDAYQIISNRVNHSMSIQFIGNVKKRTNQFYNVCSKCEFNPHDELDFLELINFGDDIFRYLKYFIYSIYDRDNHECKIEITFGNQDEIYDADRLSSQQYVEKLLSLL